MRILLTTDTIGGVWTFTRELSAGLLRRGHTVALISFGRLPSPEQCEWITSTEGEYGSSFFYEGSATPLEWMRTNSDAYVDALPLLLRIVGEFRPDVLHTSQFCFGRLPISLPKIVTAHSDVFSWASACKPSGLEVSEWLVRYRSLVQDGLDGADAVVAPTRWMLRALGESFKLRAAEHVIFNGRDLGTAATTEARTMQAISTGRVWDEAKNVALLNEVDSPMPILVVGDVEHDGTHAPSSSGSVSYLGVLAEGELLSLLHRSSIYIASSIYEPFGLALVEAALCGCAIVANDLDSFREIWGNAVLYFHHAEDLGQLLKHLHASPEVLESAQRKACLRAGAYTGSRMAEAYVSLYASLLRGDGRVAGSMEGLVPDAS